MYFTISHAINSIHILSIVFEQIAIPGFGTHIYSIVIAIVGNRTHTNTYIVLPHADYGTI